MLIMDQVEDLFYNVPTRRRAFRSASEEYAKILDMVGRYAVHCEGVAFSTKKHGESSVGISVQSTASTTDRIRQIHGSAVANEVIKFEATSDRWGFKSNGYITNANYSVKRSMLLLFINHRSVESSAIKKAVEQTYAAFLPKGGRPFVYLNLEIDPERVDVNVHPTKREVNFLNEDEIIEVICDEIRTTLAKVDTSRTFMTQTLLPGIRRSVVTGKSDGSPTVDKGDDSEDVQMTGTSTKKPTAQKPYENNLVRTDSRVRKITSMLPPGQPHKTAAAAELGSDELEYEENDREPVVCRLTSVKELRAEVRENMHAELTEVFAKHTFVGIVDSHRRSAAIQSGVKLYLIDYGMICNEYFYQLGLTDFGNFGSIRFSTPLRLHDLLSIAAAYEQEHTPADQRDAFDWDAAVQVVEQHIIERRDMLSEYFAFEVSAEGDLLAMPLLMKGYSPSMAKLPRFLLRLGPYVDWTDEKECFRTFLRELASLHVPESLPPLPPQRLQTDKDDGEGTGNDVAVAEEDAEQAARGKQLERVIDNVIFPALKARLIATKGLLKSVVEVANLKGLYKVFERC